MGEEIPRRKPTRLSHYDYGRSGAYFITICTHEKRCTLSPTASQIVGAFKSLTTRECNRQYGTVKIFQRSFHDHIVRDRDDYTRIAKYIAENPKLWHRDCFYTPS